MYHIQKLFFGLLLIFSFIFVTPSEGVPKNDSQEIVGRQNTYANPYDPNIEDAAAFAADYINYNSDTNSVLGLVKVISATSEFLRDYSRYTIKLQVTKTNCNKDKDYNINHCYVEDPDVVDEFDPDFNECTVRMIDNRDNVGGHQPRFELYTLKCIKKSIKEFGDYR
ncbi:hypothetical protein WDU94_015467 [Cyamophila willieti]